MVCCPISDHLVLRVVLHLCLFIVKFYAYICMTAENELLNQKFPRASSHGVYWENKMYKLKRYIIWNYKLNT